MKLIRDIQYSYIPAAIEVLMSTDNGDQRWSQLAQLAEEEHVAEKLYAIVQELCVELPALEKQLIIAKTRGLKRGREAGRQRDRSRDACN